MTHRSTCSLIVVLLMILGSGVVAMPSARSATGVVIPAPTRGTLRPTIAVSPTHAHPGQSITVSGEGIAPYPGVRVAWVLDGTTRTLAVVGRGSSNAYTATITVPFDAPDGSTMVCAAVTGTSQAEFACAAFVVDTPSPGKVHARFPLPSVAGRADEPAVTLDAVLALYNRAGIPVALAPILSDGSVTLADVPAGRYTVGVSGKVPVLVENVTVDVPPGGEVTVPLVPVEGCYSSTVAAVRLQPSVPPTDEYDFGFFLAGLGGYTPEVPMLLGADLQVLNSATGGGVSWSVSDEDEWGLVGVASEPLLNQTYQDVGGAQFLQSAKLERLRVEPAFTLYTGSKICKARDAFRTIKLIGNPFQDSPFTFGPDVEVKWNGKGYDFAFGIPSANSYRALLDYDYFYPELTVDKTRLLPISYPDPAPSLPLIGPIENKLGMAFLVRGTIDLDGGVDFQMVRVATKVKLFGVGPFVDETKLMAENADESAAGLTAVAPTALGGSLPEALVSDAVAEQLQQLKIDFGERTLASFNYDTTVFSGPLFTVAGLVTARLSVSIGIGGELVLSGSIRPLVPRLELTLAPEVRPRVTLSLLVDVLGGVGSGGLDVKSELRLGLPIRLDSGDPRLVFIDDPCVKLKVIAQLWLRVNLLYASKSWNLDPETLVDYQRGTCAAGIAGAALQAAEAPPPPRVLAAPAIANGPAGRMLSTYIEDTAPGSPTPRMTVMARFWNTVTEAWDPAVALTDGTRAVHDPVASFAGSQAIVAWTENQATLAQDEAAGDDINAHLRRQEIVYRVWDGTSWGALGRLTDDMVPDGSPAIAGDANGATVAWVRVPGGTIATGTDARIAVSNYNPSTRTWSAPVLLNARGTGQAVRNTQVSVARAAGKRVLAWAADTDGDIKTNGDRSIAVATWDAALASWQVKVPSTSELPTGAEEPDIVLTPDGTGAYLSFLVKAKDEDGSTDTGLGNQGVAWTARGDASGVWHAAELKDKAGMPVRGEQPRLSAGASGEVLLLLRRFGEAGTTGEVGQLALTRLSSGETAAPPLYLTDDASQHWQPALAIDRATGQAVVLNVRRPAIGGAGATEGALRSVAAGALPSTATAPLTTGADAIESMVVEPGADPALAPVLHASHQHALPGATVVLSATLRNLGRASATDLAVKFYAGTPGKSTLLGTVDVASALSFNQERVVTFSTRAGTGLQPVYAEVVTGGSNTSTANDRASAQLGALPAPTLVAVAQTTDDRAALRVTWQAPDVSGVAGYRVLRKAMPGDAYELVGETTGTTYVDVLLDRGTTYTYAVQAYDAQGVLSPLSVAASGALRVDASSPVFLPLIKR